MFGLKEQIEHSQHKVSRPTPPAGHKQPGSRSTNEPDGNPPLAQPIAGPASKVPPRLGVSMRTAQCCKRPPRPPNVPMIRSAYDLKIDGLQGKITALAESRTEKVVQCSKVKHNRVEPAKEIVTQPGFEPKIHAFINSNFSPSINRFSKARMRELYDPRVLDELEQMQSEDERSLLREKFEAYEATRVCGYCMWYSTAEHVGFACRWDHSDRDDKSTLFFIPRDTRLVDMVTLSVGLPIRFSVEVHDGDLVARNITAVCSSRHCEHPQGHMGTIFSDLFSSNAMRNEEELAEKWIGTGSIREVLFRELEISLIDFDEIAKDRERRFQTFALSSAEEEARLAAYTLDVEHSDSDSESESNLDRGPTPIFGISTADEERLAALALDVIISDSEEESDSNRFDSDHDDVGTVVSQDAVTVSDDDVSYAGDCELAEEGEAPAEEEEDSEDALARIEMLLKMSAFEVEQETAMLDAEIAENPFTNAEEVLVDDTHSIIAKPESFTSPNARDTSQQQPTSEVFKAHHARTCPAVPGGWVDTDKEISHPEPKLHFHPQRVRFRKCEECGDILADVECDECDAIFCSKSPFLLEDSHSVSCSLVFR